MIKRILSYNPAALILDIYSRIRAEAIPFLRCAGAMLTEYKHIDEEPGTWLAMESSVKV